MESYDTRLRPIVQADATKIAELEMVLFPDNCWNEHTISTVLDDGGGGWLSENDEVVTGYTIIKEQSGIFDLLRLGVLPAYQGRGIGTKLLEISLGRNPAILTVLPGNPAIGLYRKQGFRVVGQLSGSWVMRR
jgi:ribosomal protein S18 acetylase RimI-like enzyme